ncbi:hypothetical protein F5880DRAFT_1483129 [Lentinula raphanica]|nr:hypothetical protein F5880DRAFT_1483129 [Lentinula raphanica]
MDAVNSNNPNKPLAVKCTFNGNRKKISYDSAQRCTYHRLREKIAQCFSLYDSTFDILYEDDDNETSKISSDSNITEAINYFRSSGDGGSSVSSSASSVLSGRSFGSSKKITIRLRIEVEYDVSLSDNGSLFSTDDRDWEVEHSNGIGHSSERLSSFNGAGDHEDDNVTVNSGDTRRLSARSLELSSLPDRASELPGEPSWDVLSSSTRLAPNSAQQDRDPFSDSNGDSASNHVFELLREQADSECHPSISPAWLKYQNKRARLNQGVISVSSASSASVEEGDDLSDLSELQQDPTGNYFYEARISRSQTAEFEDRAFEVDPSITGGLGDRRPKSRDLYWLEEQRQQLATKTHIHHSGPSFDSIPSEFLEDSGISPPPPREEDITTCSGCGLSVGEFPKYVCESCGEKEPASHTSSPTSSNKGKSRDISPQLTYPPTGHRTNVYPSSSPTFSSSSKTFVETQSIHRRPLPQPSASPSSATLVPPPVLSNRRETGYELCSNCIEETGLKHALDSQNTNEADFSPTGSTFSSSSSSSSTGYASAQRNRAAPKHKGQRRHAFIEKFWGHHGWTDSDHTFAEACSACEAKTSTNSNKMYKCASCRDYQLCLACYSQVHERHPSHAFLVLRRKFARSFSDSELLHYMADLDGEESNVHSGIKCIHCCTEIVGALFRCIECTEDEVNICSDCETNGLPGNISSAEGGHVSSHAVLKIPRPLPSDKVQSLTIKARSQWNLEDANQNRYNYSKATSEYDRTVIGIGNMHTSEPDNENHGIACDACKLQLITGVRYQCANCPAIQSGYNLCSSCEEVSYTVHNPMHAFFKLPRPVDQPIKSNVPIAPELYKMPVGPSSAVYDIGNPTGYLASIIHPKVYCDCCVTKIQGAWFHCAYCGKDLCSTCESVDTHNDTHIFLVLKALVSSKVLLVVLGPEGNLLRLICKI